MTMRCVAAIAAIVLVLCTMTTGVAADCRTATVTCTPIVQLCLPDLSGATNDWSCVSLINALTCSPTCSATTSCFFGSCLDCTSAVCGLASITSAADTLANAFLSLSISAAFDGSSTLSTTTSAQIDASVSAQIAADGALTTLTAATTALRLTTLSLGATASAQAGVVIDAGKAAQVATVTAVAAKSAVVVQVGASLNASAYAIGAGLQSAINFQTSASASATAGVAWINSLNLQGTLVVSGSGSVTFPASSASVTASSSANVKAAGGVILTGALGTASLTIGGVTKAYASAQVKASATLSISGNIVAGTAAAADATLKVYGTLTFGGATASAALNIQGSASTVVTDGSATGQFQVTATTMTHTGSVTASGGAVIRIAHPSASVRFAKFVECSANSFIDVEAAASVFTSGSTSGVAFTFDATTTTRAAMMCDVRLVDPTGVHASVVLTNSNKAATTGRRLLATDNSSTWNANGQVTYNYGEANSAGRSASASVAVGAAAAALIVARLL